jgi:hypothetical protein
MRIVIHSRTATTERAVADQLLRTRDDVIVLSRDPKALADLLPSGTPVCYLGPWGSVSAYSVPPSPAALGQMSALEDAIISATLPTQAA